jgi:hypothetical protein
MRFGTSVCLAGASASLSIATGTLSLGIHKRDGFGQDSPAARGVYKRQISNAGTVEESIYDVLPWSLGGAYYTNGPFPSPNVTTPC